MTITIAKNMAMKATITLMAGHTRMHEVSAFLLRQPGVSDNHDLHVWPMSTTDTALTCHCLMIAGHPGDKYLAELAHELQEHFGIGHATIQVEVQEHVACALEPAQVV